MDIKESDKKKESDNMADLSLIHRFKMGEEQAFYELVNKYKDAVAAIANKFVGGLQETEDVTQEVFLQMYKSLPSFKGHSKFFTWFYRIVFNVCLYYKRGKSSKKFFITDNTEADYTVSNVENEPERLFERKDIMEKINRAIENLPEKLKIVFVLREMEGFSYEEIAEIVDTNVGTVRSRIHTARKYLKKEITGKGVV
ncbi:MAG: sigma-70 family RNA polymerase sigma factor [Candidatus Firestonebacteria bacterium]|nr:sigma-70 family RNA polymerase sigma factor [Candidatus Firestonebacteria bacterium]